MNSSIPKSLVILATASLAADAAEVSSCGRNVHVEQPPSAAVASDINLVEMMLALDLADNMIGYAGVDGRSDFADEFSQDAEKLRELSNRYPSKEVLVGSGADFYFSGWGYGLSINGDVTPHSLEPFGVTVYELRESCAHILDKSPASINDLYNDLMNLGAIFGVNERAAELVESYKSRLEAISNQSFGESARPRGVCI